MTTTETASRRGSRKRQAEFDETNFVYRKIETNTHALMVYRIPVDCAWIEVRQLARHPKVQHIASKCARGGWWVLESGEFVERGSRIAFLDRIECEGLGPAVGV